MNAEATKSQPATKAKSKKEAATAAKDSPFAQARAIFWRDPNQDRATFLAACEAVGMNPATAKSRFYCLKTGRDSSCSNPALRGV
jgi:hypothetical protein